MSLPVGGIGIASVAAALQPTVVRTPVVPLDFAQIYEAWFSVVHRWCRSLGGPAADVEDLVQDVFVVVQRRLIDFDGEHLSAWLYRITQRTVSDHRRRSWFRRVVLGRDDATETAEHQGASSSALLEQKQARQRFYKIVGRMNPKWRDTFVLFEVVGHSGEEIATLTGQPAATVRTHLHRARREFLAMVELEGER